MGVLQPFSSFWRQVRSWRPGAEVAGSRSTGPAAFSHNSDVIATLVEANADVMARNYEGTRPLHAAAANNGNPDVVAMLLDAGADIEARDASGQTALYLAAAHADNPFVITALVAAGAELEARTRLEGGR